MIKINDVNKVNDLKTAKTPKASGGESFSVYLKETMKPQAAPVGPGGAISVADAIFAAQMVDADEEKEVRKKLIKRGQTLLEKLEEIRDGLLMGYISRDRLIEISRLVKTTAISLKTRACRRFWAKSNSESKSSWQN